MASSRPETITPQTSALWVKRLVVTLTIADIDRWDPEAVRDVHHRTSSLNDGRWVMRSTVWALCVAVTGALSGCGCSSSNKGNSGDDVSPEHIAALENQLRSKPSFEAAQVECQAAVMQTADTIAVLVPSPTWQFTENSRLHCGGKYVHTRATQVYQRIRMIGPIPDEKWPQELQVVKDTAGHLGATEVTT